jgi:hypothetical protein
VPTKLPVFVGVGGDEGGKHFVKPLLELENTGGLDSVLGQAIPGVYHAEGESVLTKGGVAPWFEQFGSMVTSVPVGGTGEPSIGCGIVTVEDLEGQDQVASGSPVVQGWQSEGPQSVGIGEVFEARDKLGGSSLKTFQLVPVTFKANPPGLTRKLQDAPNFTAVQ